MNSEVPENGSKQLLITKLSYAVISSIIMHLVILFIFVLGINFHLQPIEWIKATGSTFISPSTWLYLLLFAVIIFAQTVACAKEYVVKSSWGLSRFHRIISFFSLRNLLLFCLHTIIGGLTAWMYLSLSSGGRRTENELYVVLGGFWIGFYYFFMQSAHKQLIFPVIHQSKLVQFKSNLFQLLKTSRGNALNPALYFFVFYYLGATFTSWKFTPGWSDYSYVYLLSFVYCTHMRLMEFFFELFLTQPVEYNLNQGEFSLSSAMEMTNIPIVQHLACLDFYRLAIGSKYRREILFALSQPGAHPHNWNSLLPKVIKILEEFTNSINNALDTLGGGKRIEQKPIGANPLQEKFNNMRNMSLEIKLIPNIITYTHVTGDPFEQITTKTENFFSNLVLKIKNIPLIRYIFGELSENKIKECLGNGQIIVWTAEGLAQIAIASYDEDEYAVVQKDLPIIFTTLVRLKQSMDRMNKIPVFNRRGPDFNHFSLQMKNLVYYATRRTISGVSRRFSKHLRDFSLPTDILQEMYCYL